MTDPNLPTRTEGEGETLDMPEGFQPFTHGQVLGERYQILEMLGRGGMGEVWQAFDLKLRVEVALKALRPEFFKSERRLELLRQEVRAAREVMSPNVCRIFDLIEIEGRELVSMEYVDGATLLGVLQERGPLDLKEAQDIASQFLAGLEAIHKVGLVHRDIKPENIMLTRAGRVVVMDFGLARQEVEGGGSVSGTPAYMAPEQAAGQHLDARADVYAAGVVLAEMVSPDGIKSYDSRQSVWEGVRSEPAKLPDSPWAPVLNKAVAKDREGRYNTARTLTRALEDVTLRVEGAEDLHPYPGLASFKEDDAEYFFGREAEVEQMWRKFERPHLLGIVGPSGAGKTSFIRAGVIPSAGSGWAIVTCNPGNAAFLSLGRAMIPELSGDTDAMEALLQPEDLDGMVSAVTNWRRRHGQALLIVDQFEELFTQNAAETQARFAELLGRLVLEADVFVLLSMRDDFFFHCHQFEALKPVVTDLTLLGPPVGAALRRALVQPATKCGYRFEDDELVEEMLAEVGGERGALPLLAFAAAQLWEHRDRETGLLTREAYQDIGGVGGALARHAEATVDHIGTDRIAHVRELFRNLVTAEGTRAVREWNELLSVFEKTGVSREGINPSPTKVEVAARSGTDPGREAAEEVLRELIDARLLTSYEVREDENEPTRRVEIIHESLLANWPRLVRWQTQDADAAQLRDQLRQAARTWDDQGRSDDTLWTGATYREFASWRELYPGGLTDSEEAFAGAMTSLATRRRRRHRIAVAASFAVLLTGLAVVGSFWQRSVLETRRAEAQKLIALGQVQLEDYPTAALANAAASLELADSEQVRRLALEALWQGPTAFVVNDSPSISSDFSADGGRLVQTHEASSSLTIVQSDGSQRVVDAPSDTGSTRTSTSFRNSRDFFASFGEATDTGQFGFWSAEEGRLLAATRMQDLLVYGPEQVAIVTDEGETRALFATSDARGEVVRVDVLDAVGRHERVGDMRLQTSVFNGSRMCMSPDAPLLALVDGRQVSVVEIGEFGLSNRRVLGERAEGRPFQGCRFDPNGRFFLTVPRSGEIQVWDPTGMEPPRKLIAPPRTHVRFSSDGSHLIGIVSPIEGGGDGEILIWRVDGPDFRLLRRIQNVQLMGSDGRVDADARWFATRGPLPDNQLWSLSAPAAAAPILLRRGPAGYVQEVNVSPDGRWVATNHIMGLTMWPLARPQPAVTRIDLNYWIGGLVFDPNGEFLAYSADDTVTVVPLQQPVPPPGGVTLKAGVGLLHCLAVSPDGSRFAVGDESGELWIGANDGRDPVLVGDASEWGQGTFHVTFDPEGRYLAFLTGVYDLASAAYRVWDLESNAEVAELRLPGEEIRFGLSFATDGRLLTATTKGVVAWDVETGDHQLLIEQSVAGFAANSNGRRIVYIEEGEAGWRQDPAGSPIFIDLETGTSTILTSHGLRVRPMALDGDGRMVVTGDRDGIIRVGHATGEKPHLLLGHEGEILFVAIDPAGRWIASASEDKTVRLWPMPDLSNPPLHTLPREELIAKLKTLTNLRVVRDSDSPTGWTLTHDPFPGWETVPTW